MRSAPSCGFYWRPGRCERHEDMQPIGVSAVSGSMRVSGKSKKSVILSSLVMPGLLILLPVEMPARDAGASCEDGVLCIVAQEREAAVELLAQNLAAFPISVSLSVRLNNMQARPRPSVTRTLAAHEKASLMRLAANSPDAAWRYRYQFHWSPGRIDAQHDDSYLYRLPYASGESFRVLQGFGSPFSHAGRNRYAVDFKMPVGTRVHAARPGLVVAVEQSHDKGCWEDGCGRYANYIVVLHADGTTGEYYHLQQNGALVEVGEQVSAGQRIGLSGNTGHTTMPHLHFAVYRPLPWGKFESLPFRFRSRDGVISGPRPGNRYVAD